jgi:hypothetical protein
MGWPYSMHGKISAVLCLENVTETRPLRRLRWQNYTEMVLAAIE